MRRWQGVPVERSYLLQQGFSAHALDNFLKSGQLEAVAHGGYARPRTNITWQGVVRGLQNFPKTELTVGGLTALEMQGLALEDFMRFHVVVPVRANCASSALAIFSLSQGYYWKKPDI